MKIRSGIPAIVRRGARTVKIGRMVSPRVQFTHSTPAIQNPACIRVHLLAKEAAWPGT
jgi:hypothetical protein